MAKKIAVIVTTKHRGVFFGYVESTKTTDECIRIEKARMCVYWSADVRGLLGLAAMGPSIGCRIGPPAPAITLHDVTAVAEVSDDAAAKWEAAPWSK
jgi:hypothetical protein